MAEWLRAGLDLVLIVMVGIGLYQAARLIGHLRDLRQGRVEMERFVHEFNATVIRAEAGIKGLRQAARESGDDLEKLVEKAVMLRDELSFIIESADQIADRLTTTASSAVRPDVARAEAIHAEVTAAMKKAEAKNAAPKAEPAKAPEPKTAPATVARAAEAPSPAPSSRAEKELLQALQKLT